MNKVKGEDVLRQRELRKMSRAQAQSGQKRRWRRPRPGKRDQGQQADAPGLHALPPSSSLWPLLLSLSPQVLCSTASGLRPWPPFYFLAQTPPPGTGRSELSAPSARLTSSPAGTSADLAPPAFSPNRPCQRTSPFSSASPVAQSQIPGVMSIPFSSSLQTFRKSYPPPLQTTSRVRCPPLHSRPPPPSRVATAAS